MENWTVEIRSFPIPGAPGGGCAHSYLAIVDSNGALQYIFEGHGQNRYDNTAPGSWYQFIPFNDDRLVAGNDFGRYGDADQHFATQIYSAPAAIIEGHVVPTLQLVGSVISVLNLDYEPIAIELLARECRERLA